MPVPIPQVQMPFPPKAYVPPGFAPIQPVPFFHQMPYGYGFVGEITIILVQDFLQMGLTLDLHIEEITVSKIMVATKEKGFNSGGFKGSNGSTWSSDNQSRTNVVIECQICNKMGHTIVNCFQRNNGSSSQGFMLECQICGK